MEQPDLWSVALLLMGAGLILLGGGWLLLRLAGRISPRSQMSASSEKAAVLADIPAHTDAVITVQSGGRVMGLNARARQIYNLQEQETPHLEWLVRRTQPGENLMALCAQEGRGRFVVEGKLYDGSSYFLPVDGGYVVLITLRSPEMLNLASSQAGLPGETLRTITELSQTMAASLDLLPTLQAVLENLEKLIAADRMEVSLWDANNQTFASYHLTGTRGVDRRLEPLREARKLGEGYTVYLLQERVPLLVDDVRTRQDGYLYQDWIYQEIRSYMGIPLLVEKNFIGILELGAVLADAFKQDDMVLGKLLAGQAAIAIQNAMLYHTERQQAAELAGLAQLAQAIGSLNEPRDLYNRLLQSIEPLLDVSFLGFLIYNEGQRVLEAQTPFIGLPQQIIPIYRSTIAPNSEAERVLLSQDVLITEDASEDEHVAALGLQHIARPAGMHDSVFCPLVSGGRVLGYIQMANHRSASHSFSEAELHLITIVANQVAPIIQNATLLQQLRQRALRADGLRRLASLASSSATFDEILAFSLRELTQMMKVPVGLIFLADEHSGELHAHTPSVCGVNADVVGQAFHMNMGDPQFHFTVIGRKQPLAVNDTAEEKALLPIYRALAETIGVTSFIIAPLVVRDHGVGELWLASPEPHAFERSDIQLVSTAGGQLSSVIERASLAGQTDETLQRRVTQLSTLARINRELSTTLDLKYLLQMVYDEAVRATHASTGAIHFFDLEKSTQDLWVSEMSYGEKWGPQLSPAARQALEKAQMVCIDDYAASDIAPPAPDVASSLVVPILYQQKPAGIIHLVSNEPGCFDETAREMVDALATQAAIVLGNVMQYQEQLHRSELLRRQVDTLASLSRSIQALRVDQSLENAVNALAESIRHATPFQTVLISCFHPDEGTLRRLCGLGLSSAEWQAAREKRIPWEDISPLLQSQYRIGDAYLIPADQRPVVPATVHIITGEGSLESSEANAWHVQDMLLMPLYAQDEQPLGMISVDRPRDGRRPDMATLDTLSIFAAQVRLVLLNHQRMEEMRRQTSELEEKLPRLQHSLDANTASLPVLLRKDLEQTLSIRALNRQANLVQDALEISILSSREHDTQSALRTLARELLMRKGMRAALIAEASFSGPRLMDTLGSLPAETQPEAHLGQRNPISQAFQDGEVMVVTDLQQDLEWHNNSLLTALEARSFICLPVLVEQTVAAAVLLVSGSVMPPLTESDQQVYTQLSRQIGTTLQNFNLFEETRRRLQELDTLLAFTRQLGSLDRDAILNALVQSAMQVISHAERGMVLWYEADQQCLVPRAAAGFADLESLMAVRYSLNDPMDASLPARVYRLGFVLRLDEMDFLKDYRFSAQDLERYRKATREHLPVASLAAPIRAGDVTLGLLVLDNASTQGVFKPEDEGLVASLAQQAALALENARLYADSVQRAAQLQSLTAVAGAMTASLHSTDLVSSALEQCRSVIAFDTGTLWLRSFESLRVVSARGFEDDEQRIGLSVAVEDSMLLKEMVETRQPVVVGDVRSDPRFPSLIELQRLSWLGIPLIAKGEVIGVLALEKTEPDFYHEENVRLALTFASQFAVSLENARLYEESLRRAAELDERSQRLALLNRLSARLNSSLDTHRIITLASQELLAALDASLVSGILINAEEEAVLQVEVPGDPSQPRPLRQTSLVRRLMDSQGLYIANDVADEIEDLGDMLDFFTERGSRALLALSISTGSTLQGILLVQKNVPYHFTAAEIELSLTIGNQTAIAIQNARLTEDLEERVHERTTELESLLSIITELSASLDLDHVLRRTLLALNKSLNCQQSAIYLARGTPLKCHYRIGIDLNGAEEPQNSPEIDIASLVFRSRRPVMIADLGMDDRWKQSQDAELPFRSILAVPLILGEEVLGVLVLMRRNPYNFSRGQISLVDTTARQMSISINNGDLFSLIRDQSEHLGNMLREQQIEASRSRAVLESVADGVLVTDPKENIMLLNTSAAKTLNIASDQAVNRPLENFRDVFGKSGRTWLSTIHIWTVNPSVDNLGASYEDQVTLEDERIIAIHLSPVFLHGRFLGTVSILRDVTHQVKLERVKAEFITNVSHELRTPITAMKGYIEIMLMGAAGGLTEQQQNFMQIVKKNTQRLNGLVNDLLDVSRIEVGRVTLNITQVNIEDIARQVVDAAQQRTNEEGKPMEILIESLETLPNLEADPERLRQIITNLVANACSYTPENGRVVVQLRPLDSGEVQVDVLDNGIGIPPAEQARIFERFYRGENPLVMATAGTGIGLSVTKTLVEMHHGRIWFSSTGQPGEGSIFSFTMPLKQPTE
ncbi:MAG TPA: GAF domain-containing protein [Anaerolineaceae bacterium]|nr:GAF domain-containing protein [Anaerolineaceae bacterium]HPN50345.1 GAF domain-containing protein [Anaerolineaceae bacterium]